MRSNRSATKLTMSLQLEGTAYDHFSPDESSRYELDEICHLIQGLDACSEEAE